MTRSRKRKLRKLAGLAGTNVALLACMPAAFAQQTAGNDSGGATLEEVVVTASKRSENLQDVPLSVQALGTAKLEELHIQNFADYAQFLPTVSFQSAGPGFSHAYMRGVAAINNINHSGPSPSVGMYLDEAPVTTIDGELDIHLYDIARVEALAGPQGTLFGASSQAGTIRIITNKPDPKAFAAGYDVEVNAVKHGSVGYVTEAFVNLPLSPAAAVRLVGWYEYAPGYIDNLPGTITWNSGVVTSNAPYAKKGYNDVSTEGGRAALKLDLNDNWTVTPTVMGQVQNSHGAFGYSPGIGDLEVRHFLPEYQHDSWVQSALTVEGKIANLDVVYAGAYLDRNVHTSSDYTDYAVFYDSASGISNYTQDNAGNFINPDQQIIGVDNYTKLSQEVRIATPRDNPLRFIGGLFYQRQTHQILQNYLVPGLSAATSVDGWPGSWWLTDQKRIDVDDAAFFELAYDITAHLTGTVGDRYFKSNNTLLGFYGVGSGNSFISGEGVANKAVSCFTPFVPFQGAPCSDLNGRTHATGNSPKVNLSYKFDPERMIYATFSKGFRPGGVNRAGGGTLPPYQPDYLTNYEIGWKTTWLGNTLRFNGAIFREDWKDFQFSFLGPNALTIIENAGQARIIGLESDLEWAATDKLTLSGGFSYLDAELKQDYCGEAYCPTPEAPSGQQLPVTPKFKADLSARYTFAIADFKAYVQAAAVYVGARWADLRSAEWKDNGNGTATNLGNPRAILGQEEAYGLINLAGGLERGEFHYELYVNNLLDKRGQLDRYAECDAVKCGVTATYILPTQPRTIGLKFGQKF